MGNFAHGELDESAQGRLHAWQFAWTFASEYPIMGGGFETFTPQLEWRFTPQFTFAGPHSIYFQTLGEHGFVGLALFLTLLVSCLLGLIDLRRKARMLPTAQWVIPYTHMLEIGLLAFMVSGAFLELAYFDLFYQVVATVGLLGILYRREVEAARNVVGAEEVSASQPAELVEVS